MRHTSIIVVHGVIAMVAMSLFFSGYLPRESALVVFWIGFCQLMVACAFLVLDAAKDFAAIIANVHGIMCENRTPT
jgi:hypothetical protein